MKNGLVLVAMSGGVDSSVAAALLKDSGREVVGVTMRVWDETPGEKSCCSLEDTEDARRVADRIGIPHYTLNVKGEFKAKVVDYFVEEYLRGRTPNPCVLCNQELKFDHLFTKGAQIGASHVATGHYARIGEFMGRPALLKGVDADKDQSYFMFSIDPSRLGDVLFPLGEYTKESARNLAEKYGLNVAQKEESQEICFVPDNDYGKLVQSEAGFRLVEGDIVTSTGEVVGRHKGYPYYTIGQRRGLGISHSKPLYVTKIDPVLNRITVGYPDDLLGSGLVAGGVRWLIPENEALELEVTAKIRHSREEAAVTIKPCGPGELEVRFAKPVSAIAPGQAVVFYHGDVVAAGGWIERRLD